MNPTLPEPQFQILLALASGPKHGHLIHTTIDQEHPNLILPATLYNHLKKLETQGMIREINPTITPLNKNHENRKTYELTEQGTHALKNHLKRLEQQLNTARKLRLL
ncbi:PadR family transcriptional regulator [Deinococcus misasensis]|uniref:PadR family transcriptional regulator n=1 Tax=Deinococcus misasensis TaxID=392413 RepID=UPI000552B646|nr:PadR family transcriptional regulator [Deinococcus misasensis]